MTIESLERREVFSTDLLSAFAIGNDTGNTIARSVDVDSAGNSYMAGVFRGTVDFDPTSVVHPGDTDILMARGGADGYIAKYGPDNSLLWARRMGGYSSPIYGAIDEVRDVKVDSVGNAYVVGNFVGSADFGSTTLSTAGDRDGFVAKLDPNGLFQWASRWGGTIDNGGEALDIDSSGNVYVGGLQSGTTNATVRNDYLKFNTSGAIVWSKFVATQAVVAGSDIAVDGSGDIVAVGTFKGFGSQVDFDPGPKVKYALSGSTDGAAGFVLKLKSNGDFKWVDTFQGNGTTNGSTASVPTSVAIDPSGNIVVGGWQLGAVDFKSGIGTAILVNNGGFITKLDSNGGFVWAKSLENKVIAEGTPIHNSSINGIAIDVFGSIYAAGSFTQTVDFDPGTASDLRSSLGSFDSYVLNLDSAGNFGWVETFGGSQIDVVLDIAVDTAGTIYLAGWFNGAADFDPGSGTYNLSPAGTFGNAFLLRFRRR